MSKLPSIEHCRGLSEPTFFAFSVISKRQMIAHAILFASFEVGDDSNLKLASLNDIDDPRKQHFINYIKSNCFDRPLKDVAEQLAERMKALEELEAKIKLLRAELNSIKK